MQKKNKTKFKISQKDKKILNQTDVSAIEASALRPPNPITPEQFTEYIRVPTEDNVRGRIDLSLTPYLRGPISCLPNYDVESIFVIGPTQSGKTVVAQVCVGWSIDQDPGPMLYTYPDENTAKKALDKKIAGMVRRTPCLSRHIVGNKAFGKREIKTDTMDIDIAWSHSAPTMNMLAKKRVIGDEIRLFNLFIGVESNAIKLMQDRLTTYSDLGIGQGLFISSPSVEDDLLYQQLTVKGTLVLYWASCCPECNKYQILDFWKNVRFDRVEETVDCLCIHCGGKFFDDDKKVGWNNNGIYVRYDFVNKRTEDIDDDGNLKPIVEQTLKDLKAGQYSRVVFWWDSLTSPFRSFKKIWREFLETKDKPQDYRNFIQCWLARFFKERVSKNNAADFALRKTEDYVVGEVPPGVQVIVGGIDTQDDSIYITFFGFGIKGRWLIDAIKIQCEMNSTDVDDLETLVSDYVVNRDFYSAKGEHWRVALVAWDSGGHRTKEVYEVVRRIPNVIAIKGRNLMSTTVSYSKAETHYNIRTVEYMDETEDWSNRKEFHLPKDTPHEFIMQFCNQEKVRKEKQKSGTVYYQWISTGPDHYRLASAYTHACLDMPIRNIGTLRARIKTESFKHNPTGGHTKKTVAIESGKNVQISDDPFERHEKAQAAREKDKGYNY